MYMYTCMCMRVRLHVCLATDPCGPKKVSGLSRPNTRQACSTMSLRSADEKSYVDTGRL